jgi:hypothetical protein
MSPAIAFSPLANTAGIGKGAQTRGGIIARSGEKSGVAAHPRRRQLLPPVQPLGAKRAVAVVNF